MKINYFEVLRNNIKKYRTYKGYTQEKLSLECNISADYISEIERGKKSPSLKRLFIIANALNVPVNKFFEN